MTPGSRTEGTRAARSLARAILLVSSALHASCGPSAPRSSVAPSRAEARPVEQEPLARLRCPAERAEEPEPSTGLVEALAPCRRWPVLGERETGLLVPARTRWGTLVAWSPIMGQLVFSAGLDGYTFASRGWNPWLLYFPSSGEGQNFLRNWQRPLADGTIGHFDAASFGPTTPNRWGLSRPAHVVEVEVNGGRGGGTDLHFVATEVRVLDRTRELPLDPVAALDEAADCFSELVEASQNELSAKLERASSGLSVDASWEPEREQRLEAIAPSFDPDSRRLRIVHALRIVRTRTKRVTHTIVSHCPPGAPCMPPRPETRVTTRGYGVDLVEELEFDAEGRRVVVRAHGPVVLANEVLERARFVRDSQLE
ncbi:MAG: hypothetical protein U0230_25175 [Polyangiales bacterium]